MSARQKGNSEKDDVERKTDIRCRIVSEKNTKNKPKVPI